LLWNRFYIDNKSDSKSLLKLIEIANQQKRQLSRLNPLYYLALLSSNVNYLKFLRFGGIFALSFLILSNVLLGFGYNVTYFSSISILLAFIIVLYSLITIALKHIIYYTKSASKRLNYSIYRQKEWQKHPKNISYKTVFYLTLIISGLIVLIIKRKSSFNVHKLELINTNNHLSLKQYVADFERHIMSNNINRLARVASFGGGLKSNLWNLLVMNRISNSFNNDNSYFMNRCISLSGVSGGAVGLGNYLVLDYLYRDDKATLQKKIDDIGRANILAIDMTGILFHDAIRDFAHIDNKDRSYFAMQKYIELVSDKKENITFFNQSMEQTWYFMYRKRRHLPALIINTASTGLKPGVAFSLDARLDTIFPGYIDLSDHNSLKDLRYYDAISTSNRFPVMSPAAQVTNKGFFLDGGYFLFLFPFRKSSRGIWCTGFFQRFFHFLNHFICYFK